MFPGNQSYEEGPKQFVLVLLKKYEKKYPENCTLLINYGKGDTIYVGIYSTVVALISAACALALKARHDRGEK